MKKLFLLLTISLFIFSCNEPIKGDKGDRGPQGIQGIKGEKGEPGKDGINGIDGRDGKDGAVGAMGLMGPIGHTGAQGIQGMQGIRGERGLQGIEGKQGEKGDKGAKGDKGEKGDRGYDGMSVVYKEDIDKKNITCEGSYITVIYGNDINKNNEIEPSESKGSFDFCSDMNNYQLVTHSERITENCPNGGNIIYFAQDVNKDGKFSTGDKLVNKVTICN